MVMDTAPETKIRAIERLGASIVRATYDECWRTVESHGSDRMRGHFVHPFDDDRFIAGNATIALEIFEDLPDVDAIVAPLGGGGLLSGIAAAVAEIKPGHAGLRGRAGDGGAARRVACRGPAGLFRRMDGVVRRRRRRQVRAADDVAAAQRSVRFHRGVARRGGGRDEVRRRARAPHHRRRGRMRGRRGPQRPRRHRAKWSPWCPAATSICPRSRRSSAPATTTNHQSPIINEPLFHAASSSRSHPPARGARRRSLVELASRRPRGLPAARLRRLARDGAQPGAHALGHSARAIGGRGDRSGVSGALRSRHRGARRSARGPQHVVGAQPAASVGTIDRVLLGRVRAASVAADLRGRPRRAGRRSLQGGQRPRRAAHRRRVHVPAGLLPSARVRRRLAGREPTSCSTGRTRPSSRRRRPTASRA